MFSTVRINICWRAEPGNSFVLYIVKIIDGVSCISARSQAKMAGREPKHVQA